MKIMSRNCQGLGNPRKMAALNLLIREERPDILFFMETKLLNAHFYGVLRKLGFHNCFGVNLMGKSGGLGFLWVDDLNVTLNNYSRMHVAFLVDNDNGSDDWKLSGIYGCPMACRRTKTWKLLRDLHGISSLPWLCIGDFDEILSNSEK